MKPNLPTTSKNNHSKNQKIRAIENAERDSQAEMLNRGIFNQTSLGSLNYFSFKKRDIDSKKSQTFYSDYNWKYFLYFENEIKNKLYFRDREVLSSEFHNYNKGFEKLTRINEILKHNNGEMISSQDIEKFNHFKQTNHDLENLIDTSFFLKEGVLKSHLNESIEIHFATNFSFFDKNGHRSINLDFSEITDEILGSFKGKESKLNQFFIGKPESVAKREISRSHDKNILISLFVPKYSKGIIGINNFFRKGPLSPHFLVSYGIPIKYESMEVERDPFSRYFFRIKVSVMPLNPLDI